MVVHFIGAGPGAPDLLTLRGRNLIATSPVCLYAGSLVPHAILSHGPSGARLVNTFELTLDAIVEVMRAAHALGHHVARLHPGDVSLWSAMAKQSRHLDALGIPYDVTPGVPAFAAAAAALSRELTLPGAAQTVILTRTATRSTPMPEGETLATLGGSSAFLAIHLSIQNLESIVRDLLPLYGADCPVVVVARASWPDEQVLRGTFAEIRSAVTASGISRNALILVGRSLNAGAFSESYLYSK